MDLRTSSPGAICRAIVVSRAAPPDSSNFLTFFPLVRPLRPLGFLSNFRLNSGWLLALGWIFRLDFWRLGAADFEDEKKGRRACRSPDAGDVADGREVFPGRLPAQPAQAWWSYPWKRLNPPGALPQSHSPGVAHHINFAPHMNWKSSSGRSFADPTISAATSSMRPTIVFCMNRPRITRVGSTGRPRHSVGGSMG